MSLWNGLLEKILSRKYVVEKVVRWALGRVDEWADKVQAQIVAHRPGEERLAQLAHDGINAAGVNAAAYAILEALGAATAGDAHLKGEAATSRRAVAHAAVALAADHVRAFLNWVNEKVDIPLVADATEEEWEQLAGDFLLGYRPALDAWIDENL